jgi:hypothetical protein
VQARAGRVEENKVEFLFKPGIRCLEGDEEGVVPRTRCFHEVEVEVLEVHFWVGRYKLGTQTDLFPLHTLLTHTKKLVDQLIARNSMQEG